MNLFGRRRRILIDRLQFTLLGISMIHLLMIVGAFLIAIFAPPAFTLYRESSAGMPFEAATEFLNLHKRIWPAAGLALLLITLHSVHVSHRIAGPLHRFRKVLELVARGDLTRRAGVRRKDYLRQDAEAINAMIDGLTQRSVTIRERTAEAHAALAELVTIAGRTGDPELAASIGKLGLCMDGLDQSVRQLRIRAEEVAPVPPATEPRSTRLSHEASAR